MIAIDIGFCFENDSLYHILYCRAEEYLGVIIVTAIDRCVSAHPLSLIKKILPHNQHQHHTTFTTPIIGMAKNANQMFPPKLIIWVQPLIAVYHICCCH